MKKKEIQWYLERDNIIPQSEAWKFGPDPITERLSGRKRRMTRIDQFFPQELRKFILDCVNGFYDDDDTPNVNVVADHIKAKLEPLGFSEVGIGTNRTVFLKDGYVFKIAMDRRGCVDNLSEYLRSVEEPAVLAKCYETNRLIAVCEYCKLISADEFNARKDTIRDMLTYLSRRYIIQDLGTTEKNYCNVGIRDDGHLVFIDYAYLYKIAGNEDALTCKCCGSAIFPNNDFTAYKCSNHSCEQTYLPYEIICHMRRDVDECDDETIVKLIGTDDQGTDSSNFIYVKITGEDVGEIKEISDEEAEQAKQKIEEKAEEERKFLEEKASLEKASVEDLLPDVPEEPEEKTPKLRLKSEGVSPLTKEEVGSLFSAAKERTKKIEED